MANLAYSRFRNTLRDLRDCDEALSYGDAEDDDLSEEELRAKRALISLCEEIAANYGEEN